MYDEERRFSWTDLFIKVIIAIIFILFIIWLISLPNRKVSNSSKTVNANIFAENINTMKEAGRDYFTVDRLPKNVGEVKTITLERMYKNKMLLTLTDKNGKACSAKNSYVSVEKKDNEYQMKVYLECGKESDYVITTIGCYDYYGTDACERKGKSDISNDTDDTNDTNDTDDTNETNSSNVQYQYSKTVDGSWGAWSAFTNWLTTSVAKNDYTDVETKVVNETTTGGTYGKYMGRATCPSISNYRLVLEENGKCTYKGNSESLVAPICPDLPGYTGRNGFTCSYSKSTTDTKDPVCSNLSGYTGRNGLTCNYSKVTYSDPIDPVCYSVSGYDFVSRNGFTCNYKQMGGNNNYTLSYQSTGSGEKIPADTSQYHYEVKSVTSSYNCVGTCSIKWVYVYTIYKKTYKPVPTTTRSAVCNVAGYVQSGNKCVKKSTVTTTQKAECPYGYSPSGSTCVKGSSITTTQRATCPSGYYTTDGGCVLSQTNTITKNVSCPTGQKLSNGACYKAVSDNETKSVTYYRYRTREYIGGTTDYKWSSSNNDYNLLSSGYKLTGVTRNIKEEK